MQRALLSFVFAASGAMGSQAHADVTPVEVWQDFRGYMENFGYTVTATETGGGNALVLSNVVVSMAFPEGDGNFSFDLGTMRFTREGDGVDIDFPEVMPIRFDVKPQVGKPSSGLVEYRQDGLKMRVTEIGAGLSYAYNADELALALTDLSIDGESIGREAARFDMTLLDVRGQSDLSGGALRDLTQQFTAAKVSYDFFFSDTGDTTDLAHVRGELTDLAGEGKSKLPRDMATPDFRVMAQSGFETASRMTHSGGMLEVNATQDGDVSAWSSTSGAGMFTVDLDRNSIGYGASNSDVALRMFSPQLPIPIEIDAAKIGTTISGPAVQTDQAEDFAMQLTFGDVEMSELLWSIFDPTKKLPRDPATLELDLSGKAKLLMDIFDPDPNAVLQHDGAPAELESLALNNLTLDAVGTKLTGDGAFTFDNSDTETFRGMPRPLGEINLQLSGANKLIETLVAMGILPEDQAMGARMMMAMFAQPAGDDELTSKIEINPEGHVLANGQRIQ